MTREELIKKITNDLGKIIETEGEIICRVDKNKLKKLNDKYCIICTGVCEEDLELVKEYGVNKRITYVFEELEFEHNKLQILGINDCDIIIRNCKINTSSFDIMQENSTFVIDGSVIGNLSAWSTLYAKKLVIKNTYIKSDYNSRGFYLGISAKEHLRIENSTLDMPNATIDLSPYENLSVSNTRVSGNFKVSNVDACKLNVVDGIYNISTLDLLSLRVRLLDTLSVINNKKGPSIENKKLLTKKSTRI